MNDQRAVEVLGASVCGRHFGVSMNDSPAAEMVVKQEAEGFDLYRPDDCELGQVDGVTFANNPEGMDGLIVLVPSREHSATRQKVRLVPVGGEG